MKLCYLLFNLLVVNTVFAATYRNYVAHSVNGNTYVQEKSGANTPLFSFWLRTNA